MWIDLLQKSHNAPFFNINEHMCAFLLKNLALWDICLMRGICEMDLFSWVRIFAFSKFLSVASPPLWSNEGRLIWPMTRIWIVYLYYHWYPLGWRHINIKAFHHQPFDCSKAFQADNKPPMCLKFTGNHVEIMNAGSASMSWRHHLTSCHFIVGTL